jgi:hypothetical protein
MYSAPFHISARRIKNEESPPAFYVHSKGDKAGLPSDTPIPSGYVVYLDETQLIPQYFKYVLMYLNQSGAFKRYEKGSVIPFVRVEDMTDVIYDFFRKQAQSRPVKESKHNLDAERKAAKLPDSKFNAKELKKGTDREMEHTKSRKEAEKIAKQHLIDNPKYYSELDDAGIEELQEKWTAKYKKSIDCNNPKGFSQKAHCQGKKKKMHESLLKECSCGCNECEVPQSYSLDIMDGSSPYVDEEFEEYEGNTEDFANQSKGNPDLNNDGMYDEEELYYHFDLDNSGAVTPDEYEEHVEWHADHPEYLDNDDEEETLVFALEEKKDRCYYQAKEKYDVFPSAYASGYIVRCRQGKVGRKRKKKISEELEEGTFDKEAIIIKGNPRYIKNNNQADKFYNELESYLKKLGYKVKFDSGEPHTEPPKADLWIGHSRGADRLRFAPKGTKTIALATSDGIYHPKDNSIKDNKVIPNKFHYILTQNMKDAIVEKLHEGTFDKEKSQGLHGWFARRGGKGKGKGWVDCNTCRTNPKTGRKTCKTCGRQAGEQRSKYPACRPTPSACTKTGTSNKKSSSRVSWKPEKQEESQQLTENIETKQNSEEALFLERLQVLAGVKK